VVRCRPRWRLRSYAKGGFLTAGAAAWYRALAADRYRSKILWCCRSSATARWEILDTSSARRARVGGLRIVCTVITVDPSEADASGKNSQTTCASYSVKGRLRTRVTSGCAPFRVTCTSSSLSGAGAWRTGLFLLARNSTVMLPCTFGACCWVFAQPQFAGRSICAVWLQPATGGVEDRAG
jgi:hypothetical protein